MRIQQRLFDEALVLEPESRTDRRGAMTAFSADDFRRLIPGFCVREQRIYSMPEPHTFFGIHFQAPPFPQAKVVSVVRGSGLDYVVDLRRESQTFRQWAVLELRGERPLAVYVPAGFGHAFLSLEKDTVQLFAADERFVSGYAMSVSWQDPDIHLELPYDDLVLSDQDTAAPYLRDLERGKSLL